MRHLQTLHEKYRDKGLAILGLNSSDKHDIAMQFLRENGATFPTIIDSSETARNVNMEGYRSSGVPLNYIIDRQGKIAEAWYGYEKGHKRALDVLKRLGVE